MWEKPRWLRRKRLMYDRYVNETKEVLTVAGSRTKKTLYLHIGIGLVCFVFSLLYIIDGNQGGGSGWFLAGVLCFIGGLRTVLLDTSMEITRRMGEYIIEIEEDRNG